MLGLIAARRQGLDERSGAVEGALTKIHRVLPDPLRRRVEALETTLGFTASTALRRAGRRATRCCSSPRRFGAGSASARPYRAFSGERDRGASSARTGSSSTPAGGTSQRTTTAATTCGRSGSTGWPERDRRAAARCAPPDGFDAVAHVSRSLASVPWGCQVEVVLDLPLDAAADGSRRRSRSCRDRRWDAAPDARGLARLGGGDARRARLRVHDPCAGRAARERPRAGGAPGDACLSAL